MMHRNPTLITGGMVVTETSVAKLDILIEGEKITRLANTISPESGWEIIEAEGSYIIPGGIDPHTHLQSKWEGLETSDDWYTGTVAAAVGGTTTILDFCRPDSNSTMMTGLREWKRRADKHAVIDYGFHLVIREVNENSLNEMKEIMEEGIPSFKLFMAYKDSLQINDGDLFRALQRIHELEALAMVHCENGDVIEVLIEQSVAKGHLAPIAHALTRPPELEGEATGRVITFAEIADAALYIPHVSCLQSLQAIQTARQKGLKVFGETCPQYLFVDIGFLNKPDFEGAKYVWSPPPREKWHQAHLWEGLNSGDLLTIGSDHSSYDFKGQKELGLEDFTKIPNGGPSIEDRMSMLYHFGVAKGKIGISQFVNMTSTNAAKIFGLYPLKGVIAEGSDADLVIWDPKRKRTISSASHAMNVDYSIYEGVEVEGAPMRTIVRGETIALNGAFVGRAGTGRFVARKLDSRQQANLTKEAVWR
ncbi:dihydropyrimidinase [Paenibacillus solisilvae]|uniref:Dihydropyrimidinase n=1 Tax=Paenibacillus solisilvae TaxID=2486751 RepID=A0ABW0VZI1_9BACL